MAHILGVGIATLDIINHLDGYPIEDSEVRADAQQICRGGNATNTLAVLSQLGEQCEWCGVLANDPGSQTIRQDLQHHRIGFQHCRVQEDGATPTSYIILNRQNGSRSIVHYRDLAELDLATFKHHDLGRYQWLHFEGRAVNETLLMMQYAKQQQPHLPCSLEIEKPREGIEKLFPKADVLLFSRHYAEANGYQSATDLLHAIQPQAPHARLICAWGDQGAYALEPQGSIIHAPAHKQWQVVDSLGAGDTFNAGIIHNLLAGTPLLQALHNSCYLAALKCSQQGFANLAERYLQPKH